MEVKKTKGKQKVEIKKMENNRQLLISFTKRKWGIYQKACDLTTLCKATVDIVLFSPSGKVFSYGEPSLESLTRSCDELNLDQLEEDQPKTEIDELNEKSDALLDKIDEEKTREKELRSILKTRDSPGWWQVKVYDLSSEEAKKMEASLLELQMKLKNELSIRPVEEDNTSQAPVDQTNIGVNSYPTYTGGNGISGFVFGANNEANGIDASESTLPGFSFGLTNEEPTFNLIPDGEPRGDLFDIVYPTNRQALGDSFVLDDPNGSGEYAFTSSLPINQTQGLFNLTSANGSGSDAFVFSPSNQTQGPFVYSASNGDAGGSGGYDFVFSPSDQCQGDNNPFLYNAGNENGGGSDSDALFVDSLFNQHQEAYPFPDIANEENVDFSFPPCNGYDPGNF